MGLYQIFDNAFFEKPLQLLVVGILGIVLMQCVQFVFQRRNLGVNRMRIFFPAINKYQGLPLSGIGIVCNVKFVFGNIAYSAIEYEYNHIGLGRYIFVILCLLPAFNEGIRKIFESFCLYHNIE